MENMLPSRLHAASRLLYTFVSLSLKKLYLSYLLHGVFERMKWNQYEQNEVLYNHRIFNKKAVLEIISTYCASESWGELFKKHRHQDPTSRNSYSKDVE